MHMAARHPDVTVVDMTPDLLLASAMIVGSDDGATVWAGHTPLRPDPLLAAAAVISTSEQISEASPAGTSVCVLEASGGVVAAAVAGVTGTVWREFYRHDMTAEQLAAHLLAWALAALAGSPVAEQH